MTFACGGQRKAPAPSDCIKDAARNVGPGRAPDGARHSATTLLFQ